MRTFDGLARDLRFAVRLLRQTPIVSAVALLSLALGIGANVAIFSLVNALMLKALPVHEPDRLVLLQWAGTRGSNWSHTYPQWEYIRDHQDFFTGVVASGGARFNLNAGGEARPVSGLFVNADFLKVLGVTPGLGRSFTAEDDRRGGGPEGPAAILSYGFWQREFGGDPGVLGKPIALDGHTLTIVGVTPPDFFGVTVGRTFDVAVPFGTEPIFRGPESSLDQRSSWWIYVVGRLAPGQSLAEAEARLRAFQPALREATMPQDWRPQDQKTYISDPYTLTSAATGMSALRDRYSRPLFVLLGIVGLVLTIACANMANLLLAQSSARRKELALRLSLGATRFQLVRQLLIESVLLSLMGATAGLLVAMWGSRALVALLSTRTNFVSLDLAMDWRVFGFTALIGLVTGLLFGVAPAVRSTRVAPADALRDHSRGVVSGGGRLSLGHGLVALQVALSFVLVFGSTLFVRTLIGLTTQPMGFRSDHVLIANVDLRRTGVASEGRLPLFQQVRDAVAGTAGIDSAALSFVTPVSGSTWNLRIEIPNLEMSEQERSSLFNAVSQDYFKVTGTPIIAGRDISPRDNAAGPDVVMINEAFAKKFFPGRNPVGAVVIMPGFGKNPEKTPLEVVGLVADAKYRSLREEVQPTMYQAMAQREKFDRNRGGLSSSVRLAIRTSGAPLAARAAVLDAIAGINKEIVVDLKSFDEDLGVAVQQERLIASLSAFFGGLALLLAALGLYGVMSYSVARRRNEIGIRMALGAEPDRVVRLVLGHVALITVVGLIVGAAASVGTGRFINTLLFNLAASDKTMIAITAVTLALAAGVAGYLPARRAARIDPMAALREE